MTHKTVTYIKPDSDDDCQSIIQDLSHRTGINFIRFKTVGELFASLGNPRFTSDLIIIDLDSATKIPDTNLFEIISTITTLINCTVTRVKPGKPVKRSIPIAVSAYLDTNPDLFKQVFGTDVKGVYPAGRAFTIDDKITALTALMDGQHYMPPAISEKIKPSKKKKSGKTPSITLTSRQAQILQLICDRGASNKVIANILKISESTVKLHITSVLKKFGVRNRTQLALFANRQK